MTSILFLIRGHHSLEYLLDEKSQMDTWAMPSCEEYKFYWVHSAQTLQVDGYSANRIYVQCKDDFESILEKTIIGLQEIIADVAFDYCVITNTSSYFNLNLLSKVIEKMKRKGEDAGGFHQINRWIDSSGLKKGESFISGAGIFLSRKAAETLAKLDPCDYEGVPDDIAITDFLRKNGIRTFPKKRNTLYAHHIFIPRAHIRAKGHGSHELTRRRFVLIHHYFSSKSAPQRITAYLKIMKNEFNAAPRIHLVDIPRYIRREISRLRENRSTESTKSD